MIINLFDRGNGLKDLKTIYYLTDEQIKRIEDRVFEYETEPLPDEELDELMENLRLLPGHTEDELIVEKEWLADRSRFNRWPIEDCVEIFLEETGIHPDAFNLHHVQVHCKHFTAVIDGGESIRTRGLIRLDEVLVEDTPIRSFLLENGIEIKPMEHLITIDGREHRIEQFDILSSKLYHDEGQIEVFINGSKDEMTGYSCISRAPEVLYTLDQNIRGKELESKWSSKKTDLLMVEFDVSFDEVIIHRMFDYDAPYLAQQNYWVINRCLKNASKVNNGFEEYAAIQTEVRIAPERLTITKVDYNDR